MKDSQCIAYNIIFMTHVTHKVQMTDMSYAVYVITYGMVSFWHYGAENQTSPNKGLSGSVDPFLDFMSMDFGSLRFE